MLNMYPVSIKYGVHVFINLIFKQDLTLPFLIVIQQKRQTLQGSYSSFNKINFSQNPNILP